jgi:hypothetical protein
VNSLPPPAGAHVAAVGGLHHLGDQIASLVGRLLAIAFGSTYSRPIEPVSIPGTGRNPA